MKVDTRETPSLYQHALKMIPPEGLVPADHWLCKIAEATDFTFIRD